MPLTGPATLLLVLCVSGTTFAAGLMSSAGTQPSTEFVSDFGNLTAIFGNDVATALNTTVYNGCVP